MQSASVNSLVCETRHRPFFLRCPFSQAWMIRLRPGRATAGQVEVADAGKVIYKTEHNAVGRFPEPGDEELLAGPSRNFQIFDTAAYGRRHPPAILLPSPSQ